MREANSLHRFEIYEKLKLFYLRSKAWINLPGKDKGEGLLPRFFFNIKMCESVHSAEVPAILVLKHTKYGSNNQHESSLISVFQRPREFC